MNYFEFMRKVNAISSRTEGTIKYHLSMPCGWLIALITHKDKRSRREPFFYTIVIKKPEEEKVKLITLDYKKELNKFWNKFTIVTTDRNKMLERMREIFPSIFVIDYLKLRPSKKGLCVN